MADVVIVGSGLYGLTLAERIASQLGRRVTIIERRDKLGGNAASHVDSETGIEVHTYGSHIFHTSNLKVIEYVNQFTKFNTYRHHVYTIHNELIYSMPINLGTITAFFGKSMSPDEARLLIANQREGYESSSAANLEEKAIALIGRPLYDAFIRGYTAKQWQTDPKTLDPSIISRLPVRYSFDSEYFNDDFQGIPTDGYSAWLQRMIRNPLIDLVTGIDYFHVKEHVSKNQLTIYTGPLDRFFDFKFGELSWRTLDLETEVVKTGDFQGTSVVNYADESVPFTRIHEFRHYHPEREHPEDRTVIMREYSRFAKKSDEPYYPIGTTGDKKALEKYRQMSRETENVIFGGRLGSYQYLDMHMAIASALTAFENQVIPWFERGGV